MTNNNEASTTTTTVVMLMILMMTMTMTDRPTDQTQFNQSALKPFVSEIIVTEARLCNHLLFQRHHFIWLGSLGTPPRHLRPHCPPHYHHCHSLILIFIIAAVVVVVVGGRGGGGAATIVVIGVITYGPSIFHD